LLAADGRARVEDVGEHATRPAEHIVFKFDALVEGDIVLNFAAIADRDIRSDHGALTDSHVLADDGTGEDVDEMPDFCARSQLGSVIHIRAFVNQDAREARILEHLWVTASPGSGHRTMSCGPNTG